MHTHTAGCYRLVQIVLLVVVSVWARPAFGAPIVFNDRASFTAAVGRGSVMTFDEPITCSELRVEFGTCRADVDRAAFEFESYFYGSSFVDVVPIREWSASLTFDRPVRAIGFDLIALSDNPFFISISTSSPSSRLPFFTFSGDAFFGLLLDDGDIFGVGMNPFGPSSVGKAAPFAIDNLQIASVPEPGTALLAGLAALGLLARPRWRSKR
jgi:hypothetical protein